MTVEAWAKLEKNQNKAAQKPHEAVRKPWKMQWKREESVRRREVKSYKEMIIVMLEKVKKEVNLKQVYKLLEYLWLNEE